MFYTEHKPILISKNEDMQIDQDWHKDVRC